MNKTGFHILLLFLLVPSGLLRAQWYESYEKGREAVRKSQWQQAVTHLTEALNNEPDSKANKKTYGLQFIDYFPYLYRGIAYYRLGDMANARADLEKAKSEGTIDDAERDKEAPSLLTEYLGFLQKPAPQTAEQKSPQIAQQKQPQNPPAAAPQADPNYAEGVRLFNQKEFKNALDRLNEVSGSSPQHAQALKYIDRAQAELRKIETAAEEKAKKERVDRELAAATPHPKEIPPAQQAPARTESGTAAGTAGSDLFREAVALLNAGKIGQAKAKFLSLQSIAPSYPELSNYMGMIASVEGKVQIGIAAFFQGEYREAIEQLSSSSRNGNDNPHVYAFLACSYAAEYLLAGSEDGSLKKEAAEAFGKVRGIDPRYEFDTKLISPGIIALLTGE